MQIRILLAISLASSLTLSGLCLAQVPPASVSSRGSPQEGTADNLEKSEAGQDRLFDESDRLERRLHELEAGKEALTGRITQIEQRRARSNNDMEESEKDLLKMREAAKARLVALYKFKQMGYATPLLSARDLNTTIEAGHLMTRLLLNDQQLFLSLREGAAEARARGAVSFESGEEVSKLKLELSSLEQELLSTQRAKLGMLDQLRRQESFSAKYNAKIEEDQKALEKAAIDRKPSADLQIEPFSVRRGSLPFPTRGEITGAFGPKTHVSSHTILYNAGIVISAPKGQQVLAVHEGEVMFADWFKEYGKVMIIDHGDHYYSLIAHADQLFKKVGEAVARNEVIGTVGDTGSLDGPKLYFEIRHHGKPVDPMEWLAVRKLSKE